MNRSVLQGLYQRMFVHQRATGGINQDSRRFHLLQFRFADDMVGIGSIRSIQGDKIGLRQQLFLRDVHHIQFRLFLHVKWATVMVNHFHTAGIRTFGQRFSDTSHADDTECLSGNIHAEIFEYTHLHLFAERTQFAVAFGDTAGGIDHQSQSQVGGRGGDGVGSIGYGDTFFQAIRHIYIIITHRVVGYQLQIRGMVDQFLIHRKVEHGT